MPTLGAASKGANLDLQLRQGGTFGPHRMQIFSAGTTPLSLTGATLRAQVRKTAAATAVVASVTFSIVDAANGIFDWSISATDTASITCGDTETDPTSLYVWDMEVETPGTPAVVTPLLYGAVSVFREVTKP